MPTALIADDEPLMRANLRDHLQRLWPELDILAEAVDGPSALQQLQALSPDLAFLDIQMPGLSGLQVAQLLGPRTQVVFVTAYDRYALEAFEAHAVDYLLKPLDPARLAKMVTGLRARVGVQPAPTLEHVQALMQRLARQAAPLPLVGDLDWLQVDQGKQLRMVHVYDVHYFESDSKYTRVVAADCDGLIRMSLKELLAALDSREYQQIHRSVVVNRRFIRSVHRTDDAMELEMRGSERRLRVSESNQYLFKAM